MGVRRHILWIVFTVLIVTAAVLPAMGCGATIGSLSEVRLDSGAITGAVEAGVWSFKGIPYAAPPVGQLRWQPPQPVTPWTETRACTSFGPACPQPTGGDLFYLSVGPTNEDCLYLNVWSPARSATDRLPVMVWIHGGSFVSGAGSMAVYGGQNLAKRNVVVVTINYRLGPLGFLALPALSQESAQGSSGNYGLLDQLAALQWVQRNIAAFGGDPRRVTVFGESAGAISILDLLVSPRAEGLFQAAIVESGILLDSGFGASTAATRDDAEKAGEAYAAKLGVDPAGDMAAQLRAMSVDQLLAAAGGSESLMEAGLAWKPCVDGLVLADLPSRLWAESRQMKVPLLIGSNKDEGNAFLAGLSIPPGLYETYMRKLFGQYADEALALYPVKQTSEVLPALSRMLTEVGFASTARFAARTESQAPLPRGSASLYQFTHVPLGNPLGAFHAVEIPYVFGNIGLFASLGTLEQTDYDLSDAIMGYWTRFAATGNPNGDGATVWPEYDPATDEHLELGDTIKTGSGLYKEACDLADKVRGID
jgi:para-nitrobenzyl esterase